MTIPPDTLQMDDVDRQLVALLRVNSRQPVTTLSRCLGLSRASVYARIERLERTQVIGGYTIRLGQAYERKLVRAHVMIKISSRLATAIEARLSKLVELTALHAISGEYDLIALLEAESLAQLDSLIDAIAGLDGVERTTSSIVLSTRLRR